MSSFIYLPATAPTLRTLLPKSTPASLSQPNQALLTQVPRPAAFTCEHCSRQFKTDRGRKQHQNKCGPATTSRTETTIPAQQSIVQVQPLVWGSYTLQDIELIINATYDEVVHWRKNIFMLPSGAAGKAFIRETTRFLDEWTKDSILSGIALKAVMIMPALLLQKPKYNSKARDHTDCLKRRLVSWENGQFDVIMSECRAIQKNIKATASSSTPEYLAKTFAKHVLNGRIGAAMKLLEKSESSGVLPLSQNVLAELISKHPPAQPANPEILISGDIPFVDPAQFNKIDEEAIQRAAIRTKGSSGPSGADADQWRRMLVSQNYSSDGKDLRTAVAAVARKLCTTAIVNDGQLDAYTACRLIPLDKDGEGGVRPIGVGEVIRRIIGKAIVGVIKPDILESAGSLQLCAGHQSGCEAAVHAMKDIFQDDDTEGLLLIDATNAFNSLNRNVLLHNIQYICPAMSTYIRNCYQKHSRLFIAGGGEVRSAEGTTQGDPLAMAGYGVGITPLFQLIRNDTKQAGFADDLSGAEKLINLRLWWDNIFTFGPLLGYYPNASKTWLVVKPQLLSEARRIFEGTGIKITVEGRKHLGGFVGTREAEEQYATKKITELTEMIISLADIAKSEPHCAYAVFVKGFQHKLNYYIRVLPNIAGLLAPLDHAIDNKLIPALTDGYICSADERLLLSLPAKQGGLSIPIFCNKAPLEYEHSRLACSQLINNIKNQTVEYVFDDEIAAECRKQISASRNEICRNIESQLRARLTIEQLRALDLSQMKGASSWLSALPLVNDHTHLNKREFSDTIRLRYRWPLKRLPALCPCGKQFNIDHALNCPKGGLINQRHNRMRDLFASVMNEVHNDVAIEPQLMPLTGEQLPISANKADDARADISTRGFWQDGQRAFFDVTVFNPFAQSHQNSSLEKNFAASEKDKKRKYNQRVLELEHGTFSPLVFTPYGGASRETEHVIRTLCTKVAAKRKLAYGKIMNWLRTQISFVLVRGAILCIRGSRDWRKIETNLDEVELLQYVA